MAQKASKFFNKAVPLNKVIKIFIISDFFLISGWGFIAPIFAIFIVSSIKGGDAGVAGMAVGIYWISKAIFQIPISRYLDKNHGEKDDYYALLGGMLLASLVPLGFIFSYLSWHLYALQLVHAVAMALVIPAWSAIFTRHIDKDHEAFSWSLNSSVNGIGAGVASIIGGTVAMIFGFIPLFVGVSLSSVVAAALFMLIKKDMMPKTKRERVFPLPRPH